MENKKELFLNKATKAFKDDKKDLAVRMTRAAAHEAAQAKDKDVIDELGRTILNKYYPTGKTATLQDRLAYLLGEVTELSFATHDLEAAKARVVAADDAYMATPNEDNRLLHRLRWAEEDYLTAQSKFLAELGDVLAVVSSMALLAQKDAKLTDGGNFLQMAAWMTTLKLQVRERVPQFLHDEK